MKMVKSLILGSAAGLLAMSGAQAADLPVKAKAVEYVRICSLYGAGFFYIPGTDTCIKLGGYLRADVTFNGSTQGSNTVNPVNFTASPSTGTNTGVLNQPGEGYVATEYIFLQFAGFTFGKSASAYATPWQGFPGNISSFLLGGQNTDTGVNNIQYTAQFGSGMSASIGLDDPGVWDRTAVFNLAYGLNATGTGGNAYAGVHAPDIAANIRVDQAWGLLQLSGALHEVNGSYDFLNGVAVPPGAQGPAAAAPTALSEIGGHPDTKWGGSVMAALQIKNIPTGAGDDIKIDATYAKGDTKNVISTSAASPSFAMFGNTGRAGAYQSIGFGATTDAVWLPNHATTGPFGGGDGQLKLTTAWGIRGAFNHNWDPYWSSSLFGSYSAVRYSGSVGDLSSAKGAYCQAYIGSTGGLLTKSADFSCNPDYNVSQLGFITRWTPVKNLTFSAEVQWFHLDQKYTGTSTLGPSAPKPTTVYEFKDQDTVAL